MRFPGRFFLLALTPVWLAARPFTALVYNVHNLHDVDGVAAYDDYQPELYTPAHALTKVQNITRVVAKFGSGQGPDIIFFQEIEIDHTPGKNPSDVHERCDQVGPDRTGTSSAVKTPSG